MYEEFARDLLCEVRFHQCTVCLLFKHEEAWDAPFVLVYGN